MTTNPLFESEKRDAPSRLLRQFEEAHREEIEAITRVLAKITSLRPEGITPHVHTMLTELVKPKGRPFYETANPEEWVQALREAY